MTYIPPSTRSVYPEFSQQQSGQVQQTAAEQKPRRLSIDIPVVESPNFYLVDDMPPTSRNKQKTELGFPVRDSMENWNGELPYANCEVESPLRRTKKSNQLK